MLWLILLALVAVELLLCVLLVKLTALLPRWWLRWPAFILLLLGLVLVAVVGFTGAWVVSQSYTRDWADIFSPKIPYPTARLFLLATSTALPVLYLIVGFVGLRRAGNDLPLPRARSWSWRRASQCLALVCLLLLGLFIVNDWLIKRKIRSYVAQANKFALSVTPPPPAEKENAAPLYLASMPSGQPLVGQPSGKFSRNLEVLREPVWTEYLHHNRELCEQIRVATKRPACRFNLRWPESSMLNNESEYLGHLMNCARLLLAEGHLALLNGNGERGYENAVALRDMVEHLSRDPRPLCQMVAYAANGCATALIEHAIYVRNPTPDEKASLLRHRHEFRERLPQALIWAQADLYDGMASMYIERRAEDLPPNPPPGYSQVLAANLAFSRLLFATDDMHALPIGFGRLQEHVALQYAAGAAIANLPNASTPNSALGLMESGGIITTKATIPQLIVIEVCHRADANRRLADAALRLVAENSRATIAAGDVDVLIGTIKLPLDPFTTRPLKVVQTEEGIVIYSVGRNQIDDGGEEYSAARRDADDDAFYLGGAFKRRLVIPVEESTCP